MSSLASRTRISFLRISAALAAGLAALALAAPASAATSYTQDAPIVVANQNLIIAAGSSQDALTTDVTTVTVTLGAGEEFTLRYPIPTNGGTVGRLDNNTGVAGCHITTQGNNDLVVAGPTTFTVTPSTATCSADERSITWPSVVFSRPNGGETLTSGQPYQVFWSTGGTDVISLRLSLSTDGGTTFPTVVADNLMNNGYYAWTVPAITTTSSARLKLEVFGTGGTLKAFGLSGVFAINGTAPVVAPAPRPSDVVDHAPPSYDPEAQVMSAMSIDDDRHLAAATYPLCHDGSLVKGASTRGVYYCGRDGKRHVFPNEKVFHSWYDTFNGVITLPDEILAQIPLGANVTYRPGARLIKINTDPKVYAVSADGTLHWITTESLIRQIYGTDWRTKVDDLPDAFFFDYTVGTPIVGL